MNTKEMAGRSLAAKRVQSSRPAPGIADALARTWFRRLSPAGSRARLGIVIFHRVRTAPDEMFPGVIDAAGFRARVDWLRHWFNVLPLEDAVAALARGSLPERALCVTFDDGYADNATVALPILREAGVHATFFVATSYLDGGRMWNDTVIEAVRAARGPRLDLTAADLGEHAIATIAERRATVDRLLAKLKYVEPERRESLTRAVASAAGSELPDDLMMSSVQVRALAAEGMGIGAHTHTHPILARLDDPVARRDIGAGREAIAGIVRQPVALFAYPNGKPDVDYTRAHVRMVAEFGFKAAVTTAAGAARTGDALHELPRFSPWDRTPLRYAARLARNYATSVTRASA